MIWDFYKSQIVNKYINTLLYTAFLESDREEGGADRNQLYLESISLEAKL